MAKNENNKKSFEEAFEYEQKLRDVQRKRLNEVKKANKEIEDFTKKLTELQVENIEKQQERQEKLEKAQRKRDRELAKANRDYKKTLATAEHKHQQNLAAATNEKEKKNIEKLHQLQLKNIEEQRNEAIKVSEAGYKKKDVLNTAASKKELAEEKKISKEIEKRSKTLKSIQSDKQNIKDDKQIGSIEKRQQRAIDATMSDLPGGGKISAPSWLEGKLSTRGKREIEALNIKTQRRVRDSVKGYKVKDPKTGKMITKKPGGPVKALATGAKSMMGGMASMFKMLPRLLGPIGIILTIVQAIQKLFGMAKEYDKLMANAAKSLDIQKEDAKVLAEQVRGVKGLSTTFKATLPYIKEMKDEFGKAALDEKFVEMAAHAEDFAFNLGLGEEVGKKLLTTAVAMDGDYKKFVMSVNKVTSEFNTQYGSAIDIATVLKTISKVSNDTRAVFAGNTEELTKQVLIAKRLGTTLDDARSVSDGLLNIEGSLSKEMNARVLLGRNIQLDHARTLALQGKFAEANEEILDQVGGIHEFEKMTYLQKKAVADATGIQLGQLEKQLKTQAINQVYEGKNKKLINDLVTERRKLLAQGEEANQQRLKEIELQLQSKGISDANDIEELKREQDRLDIEEKKNRVMDFFTEKLASNLGGLGSLMDGLADFGMAVAKYGLIGAIRGKGKEESARQRAATTKSEIRTLEEKKSKEGLDATEEAHLKTLQKTLEVNMKALDENSYAFDKTNQDVVNWMSQEKNRGKTSEDYENEQTEKRKQTREDARAAGLSFRDRQVGGYNDFEVRPHPMDRVIVSGESTTATNDRVLDKFDGQASLLQLLINEVKELRKSNDTQNEKPTEVKADFVLGDGILQNIMTRMKHLNGMNPGGNSIG